MNGLVALTTGLSETPVLHGSTSQLSEAKALSSYILHLFPLSPRGLLTSCTRHDMRVFSTFHPMCQISWDLVFQPKKHRPRCLPSFEDRASGILYQAETLRKHAHPDKAAAAFFYVPRVYHMCTFNGWHVFIRGPTGSQIADMRRPPFLLSI